MSEQTNQEINYYELVQRRKELLMIYNYEPVSFTQENEIELQKINAQIKKAEWLLMQAMFRIQECFPFSDDIKNNDFRITVNIFNLVFLKPSPEKFQKINHILNKKNVIDMQKELIKFYMQSDIFFYDDMSLCNFIPEFLGEKYNQSNNTKNFVRVFRLLYKRNINDNNIDNFLREQTELSNEEKSLLKRFFVSYNQYIKNKISQINYTQNCFPQSTQGHNYFTNQPGIFFRDHLRNYGANVPERSELKNQPGIFKEEWTSSRPTNSFEAMEISADDNPIFIQNYLFEQRYYVDNNFSFFDYLTIDWKNLGDNQKFSKIYKVTTYLESRYIASHFDSKFFDSPHQPSEQTRKFYMHIWRNSSKLLQNIARYRLNTNSEIYTAAQEKFRSKEFQNYILEHPEQTNDLLFAFSFLPNKFAQSQNYDELIQQTQSSKYYSLIMLIDKLIHKPEFYIKKGGNEEIIFSTLVNSILSIDPTKKINKIDDILLNNKLLVEISFKCINDDNEKFIFKAINNLSRYPNFAANNLIPYHTKILCLATIFCIKRDDNIDVLPETFIADPFLFKLLSEFDNPVVLRHAYLMSKRLDDLGLSELKDRITYDDFESLYINGIKLYKLGDQRLDSLLEEVSQSSLTLKELAEHNLGSRIEQKPFVKPSVGDIEKNQKDLTIAIEPFYLLILNVIPKNQTIPENLLSILESLEQKDLKSLADILRNFSNELTNLCSGICQAENLQEYISNLKSLFDEEEGLLKNYSDTQRQAICSFVCQNSRNTQEFLKLNHQKKREFILMCSVVIKHYFKKDSLYIVSTKHMSILYRYFQAVQTLGISDNIKREMTINIRYLFLATNCRKIDPDIFITLIFKDGAIDLLVKDKKARDSFIESPDEFLFNYKNMINQEQQNDFRNKIRLSEFATQFAQDSSNLNAFLPYLNSNEKNQFTKYYILAGGDINSLPEEIQNLDITKQLLNVRKSQEKYVPQSIDVER